MSAPPRGRWEVAPGRWLTYLDLNAWHECAHALVFLSQGWHIWYLRVVSQEDPATEGLDNQCHAQVPDGDPRTLQRVAALAAMAGPVAVSVGMADMGLRGYHAGQDLSPPDQAVVDRTRELLGIAPSHAAAFEQELRAEASTLLHAYRYQFGALVAALTTHSLLNAVEVLHVWRRGAFDFAGRIGAIPTLDRREDLENPGFRGLLCVRFGLHDVMAP